MPFMASIVYAIYVIQPKKKKKELCKLIIALAGSGYMHLLLNIGHYASLLVYAQQKCDKR